MSYKKIIILILISLSLNSCFIGKAVTVSKAKKEFTVENYAIPPEFGTDNNTILIGVLKGSKSYKKFLRKKISKEYFGEYILITEEELNSEEYTNLNKFRFIFSFDDGSTHVSKTTYTYKKYFVYDRLKKTKYITGAQFSYYAKAMEVYFEELEKKRIKK